MKTVNSRGARATWSSCIRKGCTFNRGMRSGKEWRAVYPEIDAPMLSFPGVDGEFRNPKRWLDDSYEVYLPVWLATTHGDLNEHNILVTEDSRTWLIDFYRTGPGHILRDLIELECALKFNLAGITDLAGCQRFESALLTTDAAGSARHAPPRRSCSQDAGDRHPSACAGQRFRRPRGCASITRRYCCTRFTC
jgi:hypothetical protein